LIYIGINSKVGSLIAAASSINTKNQVRSEVVGKGDNEKTRRGSENDDKQSLKTQRSTKIKSRRLSTERTSLQKNLFLPQK